MKKETFDRLFDENITKKEYDVILKEINKTIDGIVKYAIKMLKRTSRVDPWQEKWDSPPDFNPLEKFIPVDGNIRYCLGFAKGIPMHYLWSDYKTLIKKAHETVLAKIEKQKKEYAESLIKRKELIASIKSKLTKEELAILPELD